MILDEHRVGVHAARASVSGYRGHDHFWDRAMSRGVFLRATGTATAAGLVLPALARAGGLPTDGDLPRRIPQSIQPLGPGTPRIHFEFPGPTAEPSLITNMQGRVGVANVAGMGWRVDHAAGTREHLPFDADMRFMKASYVGRDGDVHHGTFAFV
jgi:hypothetical protein